jgi:hypothetical protein
MSVGERPLGAFEERLLAELRQVVAEQAALEDAAHRSWNGSGVRSQPGGRRPGVAGRFRVPRLRGRVALAGALSLSLAAGLTAVALVTGRPGAPGGDVSLDAFLTAAAAAVRDQPYPRPGPGQLAYSLTYTTQVTTGRYPSASSSCTVDWYDSAGNPVYVYQDLGTNPPYLVYPASQAWPPMPRCQDVPLKVSPGSIRSAATPGHWYPAPGSLPTDPSELLARLDRDLSLGAAYWGLQSLLRVPSPAHDQLVFELIGRLLQGPIPGALRAALYEAVIHLPGVTLVRHVVDALGRPGVGVSMQVSGLAVMPTGYEFILGADTYRFLGVLWSGDMFSVRTAVVGSGVARA